MKVILIGYRATGKSTVGKLLSKKLNIPFLDTDHLIEKAAGMKIKKLIAREGWPEFRKREKEAIASIAEKDLCVVSTGGGAILTEENRAFLKKMGVLICLKASLRDIIERLNRDARVRQSRPQFTSEDLAAETFAVLNERMPLYASVADVTIDTEGKSAVRVADEIYQYLLEAGAVFEIDKLKKMDKSNS